MGCRLVLLLDDLLWVLTDSQLKAALHFIDSLSGLIQKNIDTIRNKKAARKLEVEISIICYYILEFVTIICNDIQE